MANINLLPWREQQRLERKNQLLMAMGLSAAAALVTMALIHVLFAHSIQVQLNTNATLESETKILDAQIKEIQGLKKQKEALLARMGIIEELQTSRPMVVQLFDDMTTMIPPGIIVTEIDRNNENLVISGESEANSLVSRLMRNIDATKLLTNPSLSEIRKNTDKASGNETKIFKLSVEFRGSKEKTNKKKAGTVNPATVGKKVNTAAPKGVN